MPSNASDSELDQRGRGEAGLFDGAWPRSTSDCV